MKRIKFEQADGFFIPFPALMYEIEERELLIVWLRWGFVISFKKEVQDE